MKVCKLILNSVSTRMRRQPEINGRNEFSSWTTFLQEKKKHLFQGFPVCGKSTCFDRHRYSGLGRTGKVSHHRNQVLANSRVNLKGSLDGNDLHSLLRNLSFSWGWKSVASALYRLCLSVNISQNAEAFSNHFWDPEDLFNWPVT